MVWDPCPEAGLEPDGKCPCSLQGERGPPGQAVMGARGVPGIPGERGEQVGEPSPVQSRPSGTALSPTLFVPRAVLVLRDSVGRRGIRA